MADYIADKVIVVTGAASGFGRLVCEKAAARGASVVCADIDAAGLDVTLAQMKSTQGAHFSQIADVTELGDMQALARKTVAQLGAIDVMINNAGIMPLAFYSDHEAAHAAWLKCIDVNIKGVLNGMVSVHDQMIAQGRGHVINLSSIYGNYPVVGAGVYGASKAAVDFLSASLRVESQGKIKVTVIKPTGVPGTKLGEGIVNPAAITGILGQNTNSYLEALEGLATNDGSTSAIDPEDPGYVALDPSYIADAIISAIDQPWGVATSDITVRATGDQYIL